MLPAQRNKIDISKLDPQEQQLFAKYGKLPTHKSVLLKTQKDRKYFDSGDYALSKAGKAPQNTVGTAIPNPENIPHASNGNGHNGHQGLSISPTNSTSPVNKESSLAHENTEVEADARSQDTEAKVDSDMASEAETNAPAVEAIVAEATIVEIKTVD
ncbi:Endosulfine-domain-containing protein [Gymnopilus junonius]|uniref:mRNA stability protein n=1 Tax=Gymnopilus junonius TaxID=109634 RepID=A0A9P5NK64_GYMJU|nr:Endosulfine-domain-containing protein [Gymnopilus junonius]